MLNVRIISALVILDMSRKASLGTKCDVWTSMSAPQVIHVKMEVLVPTNQVITLATAAIQGMEAGIVRLTSMNVSKRIPAKMEGLAQTPVEDTPVTAEIPATKEPTVILLFQRR